MILFGCYGGRGFKIQQLFNALLCCRESMDSQVQVEGRLLDVVDDQWRTETLPLDDIHVRHI